MEEQELCGESWSKEHSFWCTKLSRAFIRWQEAKKLSDQEKMTVANKQIELYGRRMRAALPKEIEERIRQNRRAALNDE